MTEIISDGSAWLEGNSLSLTDEPDTDNVFVVPDTQPLPGLPSTTGRNHDQDSDIGGYSKWRWFILAHCTLSMCVNMFASMLYSSIAVSLSMVYGWSSLTFELFGIWGFVTFFAGFVPTLWILNRYHIRVYVVVMVVGCLLSCLLRCFKASAYVVGVLSHLSFFVIGLTGSGAFYFPVTMAETYFPTREWNLAITICIMAPQFGQAMASVIAAFVMPNPNPSTSSAPQSSLISETIKVFFMTNYVTAGVALLLCGGLFFYPRGRPRSKPEEDFGLRAIAVHSKLLFTCRTFYIAMLRFALVSINMSLISIWPLYMETKRISQQTTGNVLVITGVAMVFVSVALSKLADFVGQRRVNNIFIWVSIIYFTANLGLLFSTPYETLSIALLVTAITTQGASWGITFSIVGQQFGRASTAASGWLIFSNSVLSVLFYGITKIAQDKHLGLAWVDYYQVISGFFGVLVTLIYSTDKIPGFDPENDDKLDDESSVTQIVHD